MVDLESCTIKKKKVRSLVAGPGPGGGGAVPPPAPGLHTRAWRFIQAHRRWFGGGLALLLVVGVFFWVGGPRRLARAWAGAQALASAPQRAADAQAAAETAQADAEAARDQSVAAASASIAAADNSASSAREASASAAMRPVGSTAAASGSTTAAATASAPAPQVGAKPMAPPAGGTVNAGPYGGYTREQLLRELLQKDEVRPFVSGDHPVTLAEAKALIAACCPVQHAAKKAAPSHRSAARKRNRSTTPTTYTRDLCKIAEGEYDDGM